MNRVTDKSQIVTAVRKLNSRMTVADIVTLTGLSYSDALRELNAFAAEVRATLEVTNSGDIYYCFPAQTRYRYISKRFNRIFMRFARHSFRAIYFAVKLSFGLALLGSLLLSTTIILLFQTMIAAWFGAASTIIKIWSDFYEVARICIMQNLVFFKSKQKIEPQAIEQKTQPMFLLNCFEFLFGTGDVEDNDDIERWKLIAQVISLNEGVVLAEHLAPYTGQPPTELQAIFQVLSKFSGYPMLTESCNLVYVFPSLIKRSTNLTYAFMPPCRLQKRHRFWNLGKEQLIPVLATAAANLLGIGLIYFFISKGHTGAVPVWLNALAAYGAMFVLFPCARLMITQINNWCIEKRNARVLLFERIIGEPDEELKCKLEEAEEIRNKIRSKNEPELVIYRTNRDYIEQLFEE